MSYRIPLSYNAINVKALTTLLHAYEERHHDQLIVDFEKELCQLTNSPHAVALNSGTAAIHVGLKALGVTNGDEVLVSSFTYIASVNPIVYLNARPVFIDSELQTWNMSPVLLEEAIQSRIKSGIKPKAILVVHAYGMPAKMEEIMEIAKRYEIAVLEDAAEALGSSINNKALGTFGDIGIISFNNNKSITTYGGGALLTKSATIAQSIIFWSSQARENKPFYEHNEEGYSYRMGPLNAACGLIGLQEFNAKIARRRQVHAQYYDALKNIPGISFLSEPAGFYSNRWLTTVLLDLPLTKKQALIDQFSSKSIENRPLWNPMHKQPAYIQELSFLSGVAEKLFIMGLALPSSDNLVATQQAEVIEILKNNLPVT